MHKKREEKKTGGEQRAREIPQGDPSPARAIEDVRRPGLLERRGPIRRVQFLLQGRAHHLTRRNSTSGGTLYAPWFPISRSLAASGEEGRGGEFRGNSTGESEKLRKPRPHPVYCCTRSPTVATGRKSKTAVLATAVLSRRTLLRRGSTGAKIEVEVEYFILPATLFGHSGKSSAEAHPT